MVLKFLLEKEFKQIIRNKFLIGLILLFPIVNMLMMPFAADLDVKNINVSIVDNDMSTYSQRLVNKIGSSNFFTITDVSSSYDMAIKSLEKGEADVIFEIEKNFDAKLIREGKSQILIAPKAVEGIKSGLSSAYLQQIVREFNNELRSELIDQNMASLIPRIEVNSLNRYNLFLSYKVFMIPALFVILLTLLCGFLPALNIVGEKEKGTIEQMNVTPVSKFAFILAKLIPYWLIGFIILTVCIIMAYFIYGLAPEGNIFLVYLLSGLFFIVMSGFGLIVSNYSETLQQATFTAFFFVMIMVIMSGLFTPIESMPDWAQQITNIIPLTYYTESLRMVYLKGSNISELSYQIYIMIAFGIVFYLWAILSYKKTS